VSIADASDDGTRLDRLWLRALGRPITPGERADSIALLAEIRDLNPKMPASDRGLRGWAELCHALLASNEFLMQL
jgi:hypothetical protein